MHSLHIHPCLLQMHSMKARWLIHDILPKVTAHSGIECLYVPADSLPAGPLISASLHGTNCFLERGLIVLNYNIHTENCTNLKCTAQ